jgi:putative aldouronate transport system permease protein
MQMIMGVHAMNVLQRIWKYKFHYVIVIPALLLIMIFKGVPLIAAFRMSFTDFSVLRGLMGSPWAGFNHFTQLWESFEFSQIFVNTVRLKLLYMISSGLVALVLALALSGIKSRRIRSLFQTVFLLPYFIPTAVIAYITMLLVSPSQSPFFRMKTHVLIEPTPWMITFMIAEIISTVGIPVMIALAAINGYETRSFLSRVYSASRAIVAFILLQLSTLLSVHAELVHSLINPLVYDVADTLDTYSYRIGLLKGEYSPGAALWVTQFVIQLVLAILVYLIVRKWFFQDLFRREVRGSSQHTSSLERGSAVGWVVSMLYSIIALAPLFFLIVYPYFGPGESALMMGYPPIVPGKYLAYVVFTMFIVIVYMLMTVTLAYPLTVKDLPGRTLYKGFLLLILIAGTGGIHEYMLFQSLGMVNTMFAPMFSGAVSVIGVFVLKSIFNSKYSELREQASKEGRGEMHSFFMLFIPKVWKPLIALGVLQFVTIWNAYLPSLMYMNQPDRYSPLGVFYSMLRVGPESGVTPIMIMKIGLVVSLPSLILFLIFRRWLTSEVFINEVRKL